MHHAHAEQEHDWIPGIEQCSGDTHLGLESCQKSPDQSGISEMYDHPEQTKAKQEISNTILSQKSYQGTHIEPERTIGCGTERFRIDDEGLEDIIGVNAGCHHIRVDMIGDHHTP